jgi:putative ABC transport system permease protein
MITITIRKESFLVDLQLRSLYIQPTESEFLKYLSFISMHFRDIAFSNLKKRLGRTLFLIISLSVGVAAMVGVTSVTNALRVSVESKLREFGANMVIMPKTLEMPIVYGGMNIAAVQAPVGELTEEDATLVASIQRKDALRGVSPKLVGAIRIDGKEFILVGIRFRDELKMKPWWNIRGDKPSLSRDVLLGAITTRQLNKQAGDTLILGEKEFRVVGVLEEQLSNDDRAIFADLRETGLLFDKPGRISFIEVSTWCAACPVETIVQQISAKLPNAKVFAVKQLVEAELSQVRLATSFVIALTTIILVAGSLMILIVTMASVRERTQEIGILRAIGFRQRQIIRLFLLEGIVISLIAGCIGAIVGSVAAAVLSGPLIGLEAPPFDPRFAVIAICLALITGTLPVIYPARKASQLDPATALRAI